MGASCSCFGDDNSTSHHHEPLDSEGVMSKQPAPKNMAPKSNMLIPLYVYPAPGAWQPLLRAIEDFPGIRFTVVINPGNGPGPDPIPDANYLNEIPKLTACPNVRVLGYVHTTYTSRKLDEVTKEVETYSNWARRTDHPGLQVSGIFVDETPNQYEEEAEFYLKDLYRFVKGCDGLGPDNTIIHNPGSVPSPSYLALADSTVIFEDTYHVFQNRLANRVFEPRNINPLARAAAAIGSSDGGAEKQNAVNEALTSPEAGVVGDPGFDRSKIAAVIHSIPLEVRQSPQQLRDLVAEVKGIAGEVFLTDLSSGFYENLDENWRHWIGVVTRE